MGIGIGVYIVCVLQACDRAVRAVVYSTVLLRVLLVRVWSGAST